MRLPCSLSLRIVHCWNLLIILWLHEMNCRAIELPVLHLFWCILRAFNHHHRSIDQYRGLHHSLLWYDMMIIYLCLLCCRLLTTIQLNSSYSRQYKYVVIEIHWVNIGWCWDIYEGASHINWTCNQCEIWGTGIEINSKSRSGIKMLVGGSKSRRNVSLPQIHNSVHNMLSSLPSNVQWPVVLCVVLSVFRYTIGLVIGAEVPADHT